MGQKLVHPSAIKARRSQQQKSTGCDRPDIQVAHANPQIGLDPNRSCWVTIDDTSCTPKRLCSRVSERPATVYAYDTGVLEGSALQPLPRLFAILSPTSTRAIPHLRVVCTDRPIYSQTCLYAFPGSVSPPHRSALLDEPATLSRRVLDEARRSPGPLFTRSFPSPSHLNSVAVSVVL